MEEQSDIMIMKQKQSTINELFTIFLLRNDDNNKNNEKKHDWVWGRCSKDNTICCVNATNFITSFLFFCNIYENHSYLWTVRTKKKKPESTSWHSEFLIKIVHTYIKYTNTTPYTLQRQRYNDKWVKYILKMRKYASPIRNERKPARQIHVRDTYKLFIRRSGFWHWKSILYMLHTFDLFRLSALIRVLTKYQLIDLQSSIVAYPHLMNMSKKKKKKKHGKQYSIPTITNMWAVCVCVWVFTSLFDNYVFIIVRASYTLGMNIEQWKKDNLNVVTLQKHSSVMSWSW